MTLVTDILYRVRILIQDHTEVRWQTAELIGWLNEGYGAVVGLRPDASSELAEFQCAPGTRQRLAPAINQASRLLDVVRNVGVTSRGGSIKELPRDTLDTQRRFWHAETQTADIEYFAFDPRIPTAFLVYPPASADAKVEVVYSAVPTPHALDATGDAVKLDDAYVGALVDYITYRAYSKNAEYTIDRQLAATHYQAMQAALGAKVAGDQSMNSNSRQGAVEKP